MYFIRFGNIVNNYFDQKKYHQSKLCLISLFSLYQVLEKGLLLGCKLI